MNKLAQHLLSMTLEQRALFAERAGSSPESLRQAAKGYRTEGKVDVSAEFAARIEFASNGAVPREDTCLACAICPYQVACTSKNK